MLSTVLNSERAIEVNIAIMRVFVRLREMMATHNELALKLRELEGRIQDHDGGPGVGPKQVLEMPRYRL